MWTAYIGITAVWIELYLATFVSCSPTPPFHQHSKQDARRHRSCAHFNTHRRLRPSPCANCSSLSLSRSLYRRATDHSRTAALCHRRVSRRLPSAGAIPRGDLPSLAATIHTQYATATAQGRSTRSLTGLRRATTRTATQREPAWQRTDGVACRHGLRVSAGFR